MLSPNEFMAVQNNLDMAIDTLQSVYNTVVAFEAKSSSKPVTLQMH